MGIGKFKALKGKCKGGGSKQKPAEISGLISGSPWATLFLTVLFLPQ